MAGVETTPTAAPVIQSPKAQHTQPTPQPMNIDTPATESPQPNGSDSASSSIPDTGKDISVADFTSKLQQILQVVQGFDSQDILQGSVKVQVKDESKEISLAVIKTKLDEQEYKEVGSFKDDIAAILKNAILTSGQKSSKGAHAHKLLALVSDLTADLAEYSLRSNGKKRQVPADEQTNARLVRDHEKIALFQKTMDGFVFTSASTISPQNLDVDVATVTIVPTTSLVEAPLLRTVNTKPRKIQPLPKQRPRPAVGVEYTPYNPFLSFAPFVDTGGAAMNAEETAIAYTALEARHAKRTKRTGGSTPGELEALMSIVAKHTSGSDASQPPQPLSEEDLEGLEAEGIDIKALLQPPGDVEMQSAEEEEEESPAPKANGTTAASEPAPTPRTVEKTMQHNALLLAELQILQQKRFDERNHTISDREREIATTLQNSLVELLNRVPPSDVVTREAVEKAMRRMPYKEPAFAGVLPPNRPFACPSNTTRDGIPPTGTSYPNYRPQPSKPLPATTHFVIPQVAMSPVINYTGGYTLVTQPAYTTVYSVPPVPMSSQHRMYSRMRGTTTANTTTTAATSGPASNGQYSSSSMAHSSSMSMDDDGLSSRPIVPRPFPAARTRVGVNGRTSVRKTSNGAFTCWKKSEVSASPCATCATAVSRKLLFGDLD
ncbi:hypothetical protein BGZ73_003088 [Actinomortierella ambigua]|nr:hypothetical protein BGZ73_003088 [Actinomortierella ambigua]